MQLLLRRRCGAPATWQYQQPPYPFYEATPPAYGYAPVAPQMSKEQELDFLKSQAEAIKEQLEQIDTRVHELEGEE